MHDKRILLIVSGGIAAYKSLELIRLIKKSGGNVRCILTKGGAEFVTPLSISALSGEKCYTDLFDLDDESEMGHIRLSREADLVVICPASADIIGKIANGLCNDLATTACMATDKPLMIAPAMNPHMWGNPALQANIETLKSRDITIIEPGTGDMACGETGQGRLAYPDVILKHISDFFLSNSPLIGKTAIVTSGPTFEPIDPVRFIGNRSSGKQGHAIACALRDAGASVTYITGPTALPAPSNVTTIHIETAVEMMAAVETSLPADIAICAAAVADYGVEQTPHKQKKSDGKMGLDITFTENPDILSTLSNHKNRPDIVIGFAAETENLIENATLKLARKNCDVIIANDVSNDQIFGSDTTSVHWITKSETESFNAISKKSLAETIVKKLKNI
ncbi:MAG: bifunctional phosphopantothenoylcysteine decarboxylase/phosphopantothenate--cysteine ligase CoaBC [Alphaproteobacteria bacterium]|nr:MAG: bifunctional phosphopantothenoylcysteine decarboxylase/phosphopantothenate--cysteine ligase CoaBC [Alphaproteobacteria bacterium]